MQKLIGHIFIILCMICSPAIATAREHPYFVSRIAMSPDAKYIAISRLDNKIIIFDRESKKVFKVIEDKINHLNWDIAFTPDSKYFIFQNKDNNLLFYDLERQEITRKIQLDYNLDSIAFFKDMKKMIWGGNNGKIEVVNLETDERIVLKVPDPEANDLGRGIQSIKLSQDENYFVSSTPTGTWFGDWREEPKDDIELIERTKVPSGNIVEHWNVKHIGLNLWDAKTFKKMKKMADKGLAGHTWPVFSPDGKYLVSSCDGGGIYIWDGKSGRKIRGANFLSNGIGFVTNDYIFTLFTSGSRPRLALDSIDRLIKDQRFEKPGQESVKEFFIKPKPCTGAIVTDASKNLIVIGTRDGSISVYKFNPKKLTIDLEWHPKSVVAGLIRWLNPTVTMFKATDQIDDLMRQYEVNQLRLIEEDRKKETVETEYETIQVPEDKEKKQKGPVPTLTPVK